MAKIMEITLVDDLDGGEAHEIVTFSLDGKGYEIDLSEEHAAQLRTVLAPYIGAGRRQTSASSGPRRRPGAGTGPGRSYRQVQDTRAANNAIREWAAANGHQVAERGRIPQQVLDAYAAHLVKASA